MHLASLNHAMKSLSLRNLVGRCFVNFRCADHETYDYYHFANWATRNNFPDCPYNKKLSCPRLSGLGVNFVEFLWF